jgi:L-ribulose-5-phosphate 3-epimerase UlaE
MGKVHSYCLRISYHSSWTNNLGSVNFSVKNDTETLSPWRRMAEQEISSGQGKEVKVMNDSTFLIQSSQNELTRP